MRYLITAEYYIYVDSDDAAIKEAKKVAKVNQDNYDNQYSVEKIYKVPFGSLSVQQVYSKEKSEIEQKIQDGEHLSDLEREELNQAIDDE